MLGNYYFWKVADVPLAVPPGRCLGGDEVQLLDCLMAIEDVAVILLFSVIKGVAAAAVSAVCFTAAFSVGFA